MTMIVGVNLHERIYLAADSRVTYKDGKYTDTTIKIINLTAEEVLRETITDCNISVAVAGDVCLGSHIVSVIKSKIKDGSISKRLSIFRKGIIDVLRESVDDWIVKNQKIKNERGEPISVCLLFGGIDRQANRVIDVERVVSLSERYKADRQKYSNKRPDLLKALENDPKLSEISKKIMEAQGISLPEMLEKQNQPYFSEGILNYIKGVKKIPDIKLFSIKITLDRDFETTDTEWGEFLVYGTRGITKSTLDDDMAAAFEFGGYRATTMPHLMELGILKGSILDTAMKNKVVEIGGPVLVKIITLPESGLVFDGHECTSSGKDIYCLDKTGLIRRMVPFTELKTTSTLYAGAVM